MKILRYTPDIQKQVGSNVKAEPWLHIGFLPDGNFAIWVWDTRQIIGGGKTDKQVDKIEGTPARDNHKPLKGQNAEIFSKMLKSRGKGKSNNISADTKCFIAAPTVTNDYDISYPIRGFKLLPYTGIESIKKFLDDGSFILNPLVIECSVGDDISGSSFGHSSGEDGDYVLPNMFADDLDEDWAKDALRQFVELLPLFSERDKFIGKKVYGECNEADFWFGGEPGYNFPENRRNGIVGATHYSVLTIK